MKDVLEVLGEGSLEELKQFVSQLEQVEQLIVDINSAGAKMDWAGRNIKSLNDMAQASKDVEANTVAMKVAATEYRKEANAIYSKLKSLSEEQQKSVIAELNLQDEVKKRLQDRLKLESSIKNATTASADSLKGMSQQLSQLRKEYDLLTKAQREDILVGGQKLKQIQQLDAELKSLEGSTGRFQRNVGNYEGALTPIQRQVQLIAGELPNIQFGFKTFFASLSNQIQGFWDSIRQTIAANRILKEQGKETVSVFKQLSSAVGGWQFIVLAAIGILPVLYDWLFKDTEQTKKLSDAAKENADSMKKMTDQIGKEVSELNYLVIKAQDANRSYKERGAAVDELQKKFPEYFGSLSREVILNGDVKKAVDAVTDSIINRAKEMQRVEKLNKVLTEIAATQLEIELLTKNQAGKFAYYQNGEVEALRRKLDTLEAERQQIEGNIKSANDYGVRDAYWIHKNEKARFEANEELQRQLALMTEEERKAAEKAEKDREKSEKRDIERRKKALEELNKTVAKLKLGFQQPTEQEMKDAIAELQHSLDGQDVVLTKLIDLEFGKIGQNVADAQEKSNENLLGIELAYQSQLFKTYEDYENAKTDEAYRASKERLQIQIDGLKELLNYLPENSKQRKDITAKLHEYELALAVETNKKITESNKQRDEKHRASIAESIAKFDDWSDRVLGISASIGETYGNIYQSRIDDLESLNSAIDKNLEKEIAAIQAKGLSQKEQDEQIALAKAKAAVAEENNNKKIAEYRTRQARLDKAIAIAGIIQNTAVAVMQYWSKGLIPLAIAAGIAGAAQAAAVASRPLPKYQHGTKDSEGGAAIVSEAGSELVIEPDGKAWLTPEKQAVVMLKRHSKVIPHHELMEGVMNASISNSYGVKQDVNFFSDKKIVEALVANQMGIKAVHSELQKSNAIAMRNSSRPNYTFRPGYFDSMYR